jgi:hypothetical protein
LVVELKGEGKRAGDRNLKEEEDTEAGCKVGKSAYETLKHECEAETAEKCLFQEIIATLKRRVEVFEYFRNLCIHICARMNACMNFLI